MRDGAFEKAVEFVLLHEGGLVDHPLDPGGVTNWGVSLRLLKSMDKDLALQLGDIDKDGDVDADDIRNMPRESAIRIYRELWWDKYRYGELPYLAAEKIFDLAVNMGAPQAHVLAQRAVRAATGERLVEDGLIGPKSRKAIQNAPQDVYRAALRSEAAGFYRYLVAKKPEREAFLVGWLNRAYA